MNRSLILLCSLTFLAACESQSVKQENAGAVNLSFERATPEHRPLGWYFEEYAPSASVIVAENSSAYEGHSVLHVDSNGDDPIVFYAPLAKMQTCINKLEIFAWGRSATVGKLAGVVFEAGGDGPMIGTTMQFGPDWTPFSHEVTSSDRCLTLPSYFGFLVFGAVELDAVKLTINDNLPVNYPPLPSVDEGSLETLSLFSSSAKLDKGGPALQDIFGRKVLGLGENSHGAAKLFELKLDLLKTLASRDLGVVALEMPAAAAEIVDDYVAGRADDRNRVISAMIYPAWQSKEMLEVIDWLRAHNTTAERPIRFVGFDVQQPQLALQMLKRDWSGEDKQLVTLAEAMRQNVNTALKILSDLNQQDSLTDADMRYLRLIRRGLLADRADLGGLSRDAYMAMEVLEIASATDNQIALWADNTHITKVAGAMGSFLAADLGAEYASIGLTFGSGNYSALGPATPYLAETHYAETHESILSQAGMDGRFIAFGDLPVTHPLFDLRGFRYIGSRPQELGQFLPHQLSLHFDAVGYVERSKATVYLIEHNF